MWPQLSPTSSRLIVCNCRLLRRGNRWVLERLCEAQLQQTMEPAKFMATVARTREATALEGRLC